MTYIAVCIYDRIENLKIWLSIMQKYPQPAKLIVIHNNPTPNEEWRSLCGNTATYIPRKDVGMDIGAFQDVCRNRLSGFPDDWTKLLWCCDDCFPMAHNFIEQYESAMTDSVGVAAMCISRYVRPHIRTTGFMITRQAAERLTFPADPIITKEHCYQFEHRARSGTFKEQIELMQLKVIQVTNDAISPMWDSGYHRRVDRQKEFESFVGVPTPNNQQPKKETQLLHNDIFSCVTFLCTINNSEHPAIVSSLLQQTNKNWKLWLIHNGPGKVDIPTDERITVTYTDDDTGLWGHPNRAKYLKLVNTRYVVITNHDNYYTPVFVDKMMNNFKLDTIAVYCSQMIHSYTDWNVIQCRIVRGFIDCGGVMLLTSAAQAVGWNNTTEHSADWLFFNDIIKKYGANKWVLVKGCLFVHN